MFIKDLIALKSGLLLFKQVYHLTLCNKSLFTQLQNGTVKLCGPTCKPDTNINDGSRILAPEVVVQGNIGKHTDIFDLGILLWELWYGR